MKSLDPPDRPATLCVHAGTHHDAQTGGACSPVFSSTAFAFPNPANENVYARYFNTSINQNSFCASAGGRRLPPAE